MGVRGAWETEIPRHDLIGYMKSLETLAAGIADSIVANPLSLLPSQRYNFYTTQQPPQGSATHLHTFPLGMYF